MLILLVSLPPVVIVLIHILLHERPIAFRAFVLTYGSTAG